MQWQKSRDVKSLCLTSNYFRVIYNSRLNYFMLGYDPTANRSYRDRFMPFSLSLSLVFFLSHSLDGGRQSGQFAPSWRVFSPLSSRTLLFFHPLHPTRKSLYLPSSPCRDSRGPTNLSVRFCTHSCE